jgi:hypothetical protein
MLIRSTTVKHPGVDASPVPINTRTGMRKMTVITFFISPPKKPTRTPFWGYYPIFNAEMN